MIGLAERVALQAEFHIVFRGPGRKIGTGCCRKKSYLSLRVNGFCQMERDILILMCRELLSVAGRGSQLIHFINSYLLMVHEESTTKHGVMLSILFLCFLGSRPVWLIIHTLWGNHFLLLKTSTYYSDSHTWSTLGLLSYPLKFLSLELSRNSG